jgi:hypothetical protein
VGTNAGGLGGVIIGTVGSGAVVSDIPQFSGTMQCATSAQ